MVGTAIQTLALQYDCVTSDGTIELLGTVAYNASPSTPGQGYYLYGAAGELGGFGNDEFLNYLGDLTTVNLNQPIVGMATTPSDGGYWMVATDGGVFSFGDANFYGSTGAIHLNKPIVGMAATPDGKGYWMVASDGGIFSFGDANFYGSTGAIHLNKPIVGMAATPDGGGYWLVASDGGIFTFGDATFYGSTGAIRLNQPIVGMTPTPSGHGYWLVAADGGIFTFGDAPFFGSTGNIRLNSPIVGMTPDLRRPGLLVHGVRWWCLLLRRRAVLREPGRPGDRRRGGHGPLRSRCPRPGSVKAALWDGAIGSIKATATTVVNLLALMFRT